MLRFCRSAKSVVVFECGHHEYRIVEPLVDDDSDLKHIVLLGGVDESLQFRGSLL